jgi:hypothetical protein
MLIGIFSVGSSCLNDAHEEVQEIAEEAMKNEEAKFENVLRAEALL